MRTADDDGGKLAVRIAGDAAPRLAPPSRADTRLLAAGLARKTQSGP